LNKARNPTTGKGWERRVYDEVKFRGGRGVVKN